MSICESAEYSDLFNNANELAASLGQQLNTAHLLLAFFVNPCKASVYLEKSGITQEKILARMNKLSEEPTQVLLAIRQKIPATAASVNSNEINTLHVLAELINARDCQAYTLLGQLYNRLPRLRVFAMTYSSNGLPSDLQLALDNQLSLLAQKACFAPSSPETMASYEAIQKSVAASEFALPPIVAKTRRSRLAVTTVTPTISPVCKSTTALPSTVKNREEAVITGQVAPLAKPAKSCRPKTPALIPERDYPTLAQVAVRNLIDEAKKGHMDEAYAREKEMNNVLDILGQRRSNNPCLIGPAGVGKSAIVEGLAVKIARGDADVAHMLDKIIIELPAGGLEAGTELRGAFSERMLKIISEVQAAQGRIIVFIDEIHTLIGAGAANESGQDAANILKTALARGDFPCIGATTEEEFKKYIETDKALVRRFGKVCIEEPTPEVAIAIIEASIDKYVQHHHVNFSHEAIEAAVNLSSRYITEFCLPDKAFRLLDAAGSNIRRKGQKEVTANDIAHLIHDKTNVPLGLLLQSDKSKLAKAEELIHKTFVGHDEVVEKVARAIRRGYCMNSNRPVASMLFIGPTGVGKTELCHSLAELLFGHKDCMLRFDMTEFTEPHSKSRLIGSPPGYAGSDRGGELTESLRKKPSQLILFDEFEKAHRDVQALLYQVLDEGRLTDAMGHSVSFANSLVIMTTNLGFEDGLKRASGSHIGFGSKHDTDNEFAFDEESILKKAKNGIDEPLWGRINEHLLFKPLTPELVGQIAELQLQKSAHEFAIKNEIHLKWGHEVTDFLLDHGGYAPESGARGMRATISHYVEDLVANAICNEELQRKSVVEILVNDDQLQLNTVEAPH